MPITTSKRVLAAIPDLFFGSKVTGAAAPFGISVEFVSTRRALLDGAASKPDLIIVDLDAQTLDPFESISEILAVERGDRPRLVAFASHVHGATLDRARKAGCDRVLTKGALAFGLPAVLAEI